MKTILAFGETLWDLLPTGPVLGGAPCNFAYRVNSLGDRAILVTRLGRDELGKKAFELLRRLGLDTSFVQWDDARPTGTVPVTIDEKGVPDFTITPDVAYDHIEVTDELRRLIPSVDCIYCGTLVQRSERSRLSLSDLLVAKRGSGAPVFLDLNLRKDCYTRSTVDESLKRATLVKLNETEAAEISSVRGAVAQARELHARTKGPVVITMGDRGVVAVDGRSRDLVSLPGWKVPVVDTIGSGDAFSAAFLHCWLNGRPLEECCFFGNALGAMVARTAGATAPISVNELNRFCGRAL
jgi:fructokinase